MRHDTYGGVWRGAARLRHTIAQQHTACYTLLRFLRAARYAMQHIYAARAARMRFSAHRRRAQKDIRFLAGNTRCLVYDRI